MLSATVGLIISVVTGLALAVVLYGNLCAGTNGVSTLGTVVCPGCKTPQTCVPSAQHPSSKRFGAATPARLAIASSTNTGREVSAG